MNGASARTRHARQRPRTGGYDHGGDGSLLSTSSSARSALAQAWAHDHPTCPEMSANVRFAATHPPSCHSRPTGPTGTSLGPALDWVWTGFFINFVRRHRHNRSNPSPFGQTTSRAKAFFSRTSPRAAPQATPPRNEPATPVRAPWSPFAEKRPNKPNARSASSPACLRANVPLSITKRTHRPPFPQSLTAHPTVSLRLSHVRTHARERKDSRL